MTELRDARLRKAMEEAPDAALQPSARTRAAIHAAAHEALQPWWRRWWPADSGRRGSWSAAFATVLIAGLVTLLWQGQEVPGPRLDGPMPDPRALGRPPVPSAPVAAPAPAPAESAAVAATAPAAPAAPTAAPPLLPAPKPAPQRPPAYRNAPSGSVADAKVAEAAAPEPAPAPRTATAPVPTPPSPAADVVAPAPAPAAVAQAPAPAAPLPPATAPAAAAPAAPAPSVQAPQADTALAKQASPPAAASESRQRRAEAQGMESQLRAGPVPAGLNAWTQVRIESGNVSVVVPRDRAGRLAELTERASRAERSAAHAGRAELLIEYGRGDQVLGWLEWATGQWRVRLAGETARGLALQPALADELREEAQRLLRR